MSNPKMPSILILVEGAKTDFALMQKLLNIYGISSNHQIVSYNTRIYDLYQKLYYEDDPDALDLLQVLKEHEPDESIKTLFDIHYSDIILVFDLDPQDPDFSPEAISKMASYFNESSNNGKLYLNYPMVEAFYHMRSIPDPLFNSYMIAMNELRHSNFKSHTKDLCRIPYRRFASSKSEMDTIILQNLRKAQSITNQSELKSPSDSEEILSAQLVELHQNQRLYILCTCIFYIWDYNPSLVFFS